MDQLNRKAYAMGDKVAVTVEGTLCYDWLDGQQVTLCEGGVQIPAPMITSVQPLTAPAPASPMTPAQVATTAAGVEAFARTAAGALQSAMQLLLPGLQRAYEGVQQIHDCDPGAFHTGSGWGAFRSGSGWTQCPFCPARPA